MKKILIKFFKFLINFGTEKMDKIKRERDSRRF